MNQETLQPCFDKSVNRFLYFLPVAAVIAGHEFINCQAAVHLKVEDGFRLFKRKDAVRHEPGNILFLMIRHFVNNFERWYHPGADNGTCYCCEFYHRTDKNSLENRTSETGHAP